jgi:hypothetical protein
MKKSSLAAQKMKRTVWSERAGELARETGSSRRQGARARGGGEEMYPVRVIQIQDPALRLVDVLVALVHAADHKGGVHVHVMAREVQRDEPLEEDSPPGEGGREEDEEARRRAPVRHHVQDGPEPRRLVKVARRIAVERVEEFRDRVQEGAGSGVEGHVVERGDGEDDARVACVVIVLSAAVRRIAFPGGPGYAGTTGRRDTGTKGGVEGSCLIQGMCRTDDIWPEKEDVLLFRRIRTTRLGSAGIPLPIHDDPTFASPLRRGIRLALSLILSRQRRLSPCLAN